MVVILGLDTLEMAHELLDPIKVTLLRVIGEMAVAQDATALVQKLRHRGEL